ncbi:MAG TPA: hypothetical protein VGE01_08665 [Fimbriimonas sp.]
MALALPQASPISPEAELETALGTAGLSAKTARFDETTLRFFRQGEFSTPLYNGLSENPWKMPFLMRVKRQELSAYAGRPSDSLTAGGLWLGWATRRTLIGNPIADDEKAAQREAALNEVLIEMRKRGVVGKVPSLSRLPPQVRKAAALVLWTIVRVRDYRAVAIRDMGDPATTFRAMTSEFPDEGLTATANRIDLYRKFRTNYMAAGAHDLLLSVQTASKMLAEVPPGLSYSTSIPTAWGEIVLTGGSATTHADQATLLTIDTGGNDVYLNGPSTKSHQNWCSVSIDTEGNDKYVAANALQTTPVAQFTGRKGSTLPGPGGAVMGYSAIFDLGGDDLYRSHGIGLGSGRMGVGAVYDAGGNDVYDAYADSQGCGLFGAGILEDAGAGNDRYLGFNQVQGVGLTQGFGYLVDRGGNDEYVSNDETIDFPSPQSAQHNVGMSQGAGNGRRADYLEGNSLAGGFGVLFDQSGDDRYLCGVFGQGVGYWMSVGALWDGGGKDAYSGQWYVQGASAHFAIGYLEDEGGDDEYLAPMNMAQGAGHDFSVGVLVDRSGNDRYTAPNLSLGAGNANGIGWFADLAGNDAYASSGITLGRGAEAPGQSLRERGLTLGVFMDLAGQDTYPAAAAWAKNQERAANWTRQLADPSESQLGVFWDR